MPARIIHDVQLVSPAGARLWIPRLAAELPVLIVAGLLVADDALLMWLRDYAAAGGHLVIGPRTAYGDGEGRARTEVKPALLADAAGVHYQEFSNLGYPVPVAGAGIACRAAGGTAWVDRLTGDAAGPRLRPPPLRPLPGRGHQQVRPGPDHHRRYRPRSGHGRQLDPLARSVSRASPGGTSRLGHLHSATNANGERIHVVHNWSWTPARITLPTPMTDLLADSQDPVDELASDPGTSTSWSSEPRRSRPAMKGAGSLGLQVVEFDVLKYTRRGGRS